MPAARQEPTEKGAEIAAKLLDWYDLHRRHLPWRASPGKRQDPYKVWLSEIMLQQTTVKAVLPRYADFLARWPSVEALAAAELGQVLAAWAGLGYYARARNLHACACAVVSRFGGRFPETETELRKLPGIGAYTAAAIAAIAFGKRATPVDGNIERVVARLFAITETLPKAKPGLKRLAETLTPEARAGDFAQSLMDLGAGICSPSRPSCGVCPIVDACSAYAQGLAEVLPYRDEKAERPVRRGTAFVVLREGGAVLLRERPLNGLLGGMLEVPSTPWAEGKRPNGKAEAYAPVEAEWSRLPGLVQHTFTHFHLELQVQRAEIGHGCPLKEAAEPERCRFVRLEDLGDAALPTIMRKVLAHALGARTARLTMQPRPKPQGARAPSRADRRSA
jgi:A/G-specific adenine glycosylase